MTGKQSNLIIQGKLFWASVHTVNPYSGKYQVDVSVDDETAKKLTALGVVVKKEEDMKDTKHVGTVNDRNQFVTAKRSLTTKDGTIMEKPLVIDAKKNVLGAGVALGNGTLANIKVNPYEWSFKGKKGVSLGFSTIQVLNLVEFKSGSLDGFDVEDGYEATPSMSDSSSNEDINENDDDAPFDLES